MAAKFDSDDYKYPCVTDRRQFADHQQLTPTLRGRNDREHTHKNRKHPESIQIDTFNDTHTEVMATKAQNQFAKFVASSPLSSIPHDPVLDLASNCVRDSLGGPTVQLVFDGLAARGESTLTQLMSYIEEKCYATSQKQSQERIIRLAKMRVTSSQGECPSRPMIRAALLVLIQHSIVAVKKADVNVNLSTKNSKKKRRRARKTVYTYSVDVDRARVLPRYPRFIEFVKKAIGEMPAIILEEVLLLGRAPTMHIIIKTLDHVYQHQQLEQEIAEEAINGHDSTSSAPIAPMTNSFGSYSDRNVCRKKVLESFKNLAHSGFLEQVKEIQWKTQTDDDEGEYLFEGDNEKLEPASKKQKQSQSFDKYQLEIPAEDNGDDPEAFAVTALLQEEPFASSLPRDTVWSVNIPMLHEQLRALNLGWLAMERFGDKLVGVGSIVTAGLKLVANRRHTTKPGSRCMDFDSLNNFTVGEILPYIPKAMLQRFDNTEGGAEKGVFNTLVQLSKMRNPRVIEVTEVAPGQPANTRFQSRPQQMLSYLRQRIVHQASLFVFDPFTVFALYRSAHNFWLICLADYTR
jgi:hypothetical protein